jgi:hypothetical protein
LVVRLYTFVADRCPEFVVVIEYMDVVHAVDLYVEVAAAVVWCSVVDVGVVFKEVTTEYYVVCLRLICFCVNP